jgi:hypothetical protein
MVNSVKIRGLMPEKFNGLGYLLLIWYMGKRNRPVNGRCYAAMGWKYRNDGLYRSCFTLK